MQQKRLISPYPFGSPMPTRTWSDPNSKYKYGFNAQEKDDEIAGEGNISTAMFWEYDTRLGRRWNLDPEGQLFLSNYSVLANNPFLNNDVLGNKFKIIAETPEKEKEIKEFIKNARKSSRTFNALYKDLKRSKKIYEIQFSDIKGPDKKHEFQPTSTGGKLILAYSDKVNYNIREFGMALGDAWLTDRGLFPISRNTMYWGEGKQREAQMYNSELESKIARQRALGNIENLMSVDLNLKLIESYKDLERAVVKTKGDIWNQEETIEFETAIVVINISNYNYRAKNASIWNFFQVPPLKANGKVKKKKI